MYFYATVRTVEKLYIFGSLSLYYHIVSCVDCAEAVQYESIKNKNIVVTDVQYL